MELTSTLRDLNGNSCRLDLRRSQPQSQTFFGYHTFFGCHNVGHKRPNNWFSMFLNFSTVLGVTPRSMTVSCWIRNRGMGNRETSPNAEGAGNVQLDQFRTARTARFTALVSQHESREYCRRIGTTSQFTRMVRVQQPDGAGEDKVAHSASLGSSAGASVSSP